MFRDGRPQETSTVIAHLQSTTSLPITLSPKITQSFTIFTKQGNILSTTLQHIGKHAGQPLVAASVTGQSQSHLFYITDHNSGLHLLVDTGPGVIHLQILNTNTNKMDLHYKQLVTPQSRLMILGSSHSISTSVEHFDGPSL